MTQTEAKAAVQKYGNQVKAAKALGMPRATFGEYFRGVHKTDRSIATCKTTGQLKNVKRLADFRAVHDKSFIVPARVKDALAALGKDGWEYETQFAHDAGVTTTDLAAFRDQFAAHIVHLRRESKRVWVGSKATAITMREMV